MAAEPDDAWKRLTDARLKMLEVAVNPPRIRRSRSGVPMHPVPYEPGDRQPLTKYLAVRLFAVELLLRLMLDADERRAEVEEWEHGGLEDLIEPELARLEMWSQLEIEPDIERRETQAMIQLVRVILTEAHTWPLIELEERGL